MPRLSPHLLVIPVAAAIGLGVACLHPDQFRDDPAAPLDESKLDPTLRGRLAQNDAAVNYKDYLVRELIDGRMTLAEVADEFLRVNAEEPAILESILKKYPGADDREKSAHNVLAFASARCLNEAEAEEMMARLSTQFAALFGHHPVDVAT
jgi:hypothetical protein